MLAWVMVGFSIALFLYLRANTHTVEDARPSPDQVPGFGPQISLTQAASGYFSHLISWLLIIGWTMAMAFRIYIGDWSIYDLLVVAGILLSWPLQEWFVHAQLEHLKPLKLFGRTIELVITKTHRAHHLNPWDPKYGLSPPHIMVLYFLGLPLFCYLTAPLTLAATATLTTLTMIQNYEWVHYLIHTSYQPRTRLYKRLWRHHRLHHFKNEQFWFGLTMISGDTFMNTNPPPSEAERSASCLTLAPEDGPLTESDETSESANMNYATSSSNDE